MEPLFDGGLVKPGAFVAAVGSSKPVAPELDDALLSRAALIAVEWLPAAEGEFSWRDPSTGVELYGLNLAILRDGHFDVVLLTGPDDQRTLVGNYFDQSAQTFRAG